MVERTERRKITFIDQLADGADQILFVVFFLLGAAAILTLKEFRVPQVIVTIVPILIMLIYVPIAWVSKRYRVREDRLGDNIYYLGFLYTLVSLSFTLYQFATAGQAVESIISNFGIALATTIVGVLLRVVFTQMREDPVVYEREARLDLAEAARNVKGQLDDVAIRMGDFMRRLVQTMEEGFTNMSGRANAALAENVTRFASVSQEVLDKIHVAFDAFNTHSAKLNEAADETVRALQSLVARIENIEASPDLLSSRIDPLLAKFDEVAEESKARTRAHNQEIKRTKDLVELASQIAGHLKTTIEAADVKAAAHMDDFSGNLQRGIEASKQLAAIVTEAATAIRDQIAALRSSTAQISTLVEAETAANKASLGQLRATMDSDITAIRNSRDETARAVEEARRLLLTLEATLVSLSQTMIQKLDAP